MFACVYACLCVHVEERILTFITASDNIYNLQGKGPLHVLISEVAQRPY